MKGEQAREGNKYNQNFQGKFCACGEEYDPEKEKGTMFQCLGLGHVEDGGCDEDWWHPECLLGLSRTKHDPKAKEATNGSLETVKEETDGGVVPPTTYAASADEHHHVDDAPLPAGFPEEDDFDHLICYKCVNAFPWIKAYAGSPGFLTASNPTETNGHTDEQATETPPISSEIRKRKAEDDVEHQREQHEIKRSRSEEPFTTGETEVPQSTLSTTPMHATLSHTPTGDYITLFLKEDFRDHLCRCPDCFPHLAKHDQLLEEEEAYEPPLSESEGGSTDGNAPRGPGSVNSGSLLDRGEAALSSIDRVRAIEGVMAYNHVKDKVKAFLQPFAESGQPVGAEDIKAYFAKLRGDEMAEREAAVRAEQGGASGGSNGGYRRGQEGY